MKKYLKITLLSIAVLLFGGFAYSCTEDSSFDNVSAPGETQVINLDPQYDVLVDSLTKLTNTTVLDFQVNMHTSRASFWKKWTKKLFVVVLCDAIGGVTGNIVGAAFTSYCAARSQGLLPYNPGDVDILNNRSLDQQLLADTTWARTPADNSGYLHNKVLVQLYEKHGDDLLTIPTNQIYAEADSIVTNDFGIGIVRPADQSAAETLYAQLAEVGENSETITDFFTAWKQLHPDNRNQWNVLEVVMNGFYELDLNADNGQYLNSVIQTINTSSLPDEEKQSLRTCISIGHASAFLWSRQVFPN